MTHLGATAELVRLATEAAEWVDRLKEAGSEDRRAFADWLEQSPEHREEFLWAATIDLAIRDLHSQCLLAETQEQSLTQARSGPVSAPLAQRPSFRRPQAQANEVDGLCEDFDNTENVVQIERDRPPLPSVTTAKPHPGSVMSDEQADVAVVRSAQFIPTHNPRVSGDSLVVEQREDECPYIHDARLPESIVRRVRAIARTITGEKNVTDEILHEVQLQLSNMSREKWNQIKFKRGYILHVAQNASRTWLKRSMKCEMRSRLGEFSGQVNTVEDLIRALKPLGRECAEAYLRARILGRSTRSVALSMRIPRITVDQHLVKADCYFANLVESDPKAFAVRVRPVLGMQKRAQLKNAQVNQEVLLIMASW